MRRAKSQHHRTRRTPKPREFTCRVAECSKSYVYRQNLKRHEQSHNPTFVYACDLPNCDRTFERKDSYQRHLKTQHHERFFGTTSEDYLKSRQRADETENERFVRNGPGSQAAWEEVPGATQGPGRENLFTLPSGVGPVYMSRTDWELLQGLAMRQVGPLMDFVRYYFCCGGPMSQSAMRYSLNSLAVASLGCTPGYKWLRQLSQYLYIQALGRLSSAVQHEPGEGSTIIAAYGLGMFEMTTCGDSLSHFRGLVSLLDLRGKEDIHNKIELRVLIWLKFQTITEHIMQGRKMKELGLFKVVTSLKQSPEAYSDRLAWIMGKILRLQEEIHEGILNDPREIRDHAKWILAELSYWKAHLPPKTFDYFEESLPTELPLPWERRIFYGERYHIYRDGWACHVMNQYYCAQIIVYLLISTVSYAPDIADSLLALGSKICASVAFHFGVRPIRDSELIKAISQSAIHGVVILWPLLLAAATGSKPREWVRSCLEVMDENMNNDRISILRNSLKGENVDIFGALSRRPLDGGILNRPSHADSLETDGLYLMRKGWKPLLAENTLSLRPSRCCHRGA